MKEADIQAFLVELYQAGQQNDAREQERSKKMLNDAFIFADNVHSHPQEIAGYLATLNALPQFKHIIVPVGKGLSIAYRWNES